MLIVAFVIYMRSVTNCLLPARFHRREEGQVELTVLLGGSEWWKFAPLLDTDFGAVDVLYSVLVGF